jgi:hypothetical protein
MEKKAKARGLTLKELEVHSRAEHLPERLEMRRRSRRWRRHHAGGGGSISA